MGKRKLKIHLDEKGKIEKEMDDEMSLADARKELLDLITFPFVFADEDENEIPKDKEVNTMLKDVLYGKNLLVKKEKIIRKMLGVKCESKNGIDFYVYREQNHQYYKWDKRWIKRYAFPQVALKQFYYRPLHSASRTFNAEKVLYRTW